MIPVTGLLVSAIVFVFAVIPSVQLARWLVRRDALTNRKGAFIAFWISMLLGGFLGLLKADLSDVVFGAFYLSFGTIAFWAAAVRNQEVEQAVDGNPH